MTLNERIFDLLSRKEKTQTDIARLLNIRPTTVSEWRKGKYTPSVANCVALADFFGVSLDYLITGREPRGAPVQQIIGNNNSNNTAIAGAVVVGGDNLPEYERELLKVAGAFDMRRKNDLLSYAYKLEKQIKDEGGL